MSRPHHGVPVQPAGTTPPVQPKRHAGHRRLLTRTAGRLRLAVLLALVLPMAVVVGTPHSANADPTPVNLGDAEPFGVLASSAVTNANLTAVTGDLGVSPGNSVTGFPPGTVSGTIHAGDGTATAAKADAVAAYNDIAGRTPDATVAPALGGTTKTPGVYASTNGTFGISGTLTLDAQGTPEAIFIFKATTLTAANVSNISLVGGAQADNLFWQITDTVNLGTYCTFRGNVLASESIMVNSGAAVFGRLFSLDDAIVLQGTGGLPATRVTLPNDPPTTTTLTSSLDPSKTGQAVTFTATVEGDIPSVVPAGQVVFKDGTTIIGSDYHDSEGPATFTISSLTEGDHPITAVYLGGDTFNHEQLIHFAPSTSPQLIQNVSANTLWDNTATPATQSQDPRAVTLGVKFKASTSGTIQGLRFYKGALNTGTHTGGLWTSGGTLLASATFTNESASGWQRVNFSAPVAITANTTYVASYHTTSGFFSVTRPYFTNQYVNGPLTALADGASGGNGVYTYGATSAFPTTTYLASNYWVDVMFTPSNSLWDNTVTPATQSQDSQAVTVGVKFKANTSGTVQGLRFYKGPQNTGTHTGGLWTSGGTLLASAASSGESASGWQQVNFPAPVAITANTTYVASYHTTSGFFSVTKPYFGNQYVNGPLTALADGASGGNGVYTYGATNTFPTSTFQASNYWVDVVFFST
ncbi:DUF4082 domain-containing protein [Streptosporangium canum]|uniref:DUF4082 domain-containing protein n=1 Tax=Streptosporangium canum TaxID=324952 RepID=UPI00378AED39